MPRHVRWPLQRLRSARATGVLAMTLISLSMAQCRDNATAPQQVASVRISPAGATIGVGEQAVFTARALDAAGAVVPGKSCSFNATDPGVARIGDGPAFSVTVTALAVGVTTIEAECDGKTAGATLTVRQHPDIQVNGRVVDAETGQGIGSAGIDYTIGNDPTVHTTTSNADGNFSFSVATETGAAAIDVTASKTDYVTTTLFITVVEVPGTQLEPILLVRQRGDPGSISGTIRNARDNSSITAAEIVLYRGQGLSLVNPVAMFTSDASGGYTFNSLAAGTYTVYANAQGFSPGHRTAITVFSGAVVAQDVNLSPTGLNEIRIVLTWGSTPRDLDAHLTGPNPSDAGRFHVYYANRLAANVSPFAGLDTDDTSSFGPETITISQVHSGVYRFSVHDFTNRASATSRELGTSGAKVEVYYAGMVRETFHVPNQPGTLWTVFELTGTVMNPSITARNEIGLAEDPFSIPKPSAGGTDATD